MRLLGYAVPVGICGQGGSGRGSVSGNHFLVGATEERVQVIPVALPVALCEQAVLVLLSASEGLSESLRVRVTDHTDFRYCPYDRMTPLMSVSEGTRWASRVSCGI